MKIFNGWRLTGILTVGLLALGAILALRHGGSTDDIRLVIRVTARTSIALFLLAFTASALAQLAPNAMTAWQLRNRRYLGVSFAASHTIHLLAIIRLASMDQSQFWQGTNLGAIMPGGIAYGFIIALGVTSFDRSVAWLGPRRWRWLHLIGSWYICFIFFLSIAKRFKLGALYWWFAALFVAAALVRLCAYLRRRQARV